MKSKFCFLSALLLMLMLVDASAASKQRKAESIRRTVQKYVQSAELISDMENVSVYSGRQNGYVVVSKSENMPEVLGYGSGKLNAKEMPEGMKWLISYYNSIAEAVDAGKMNAPRVVRPPHAVEPLTKTTWAQDAPFWDMLPTAENKKTGTQDTIVVGCVATSVSQIVYYHKWPERGQGSATWHCDLLGDMSADFSNSVYDWNNMLLSYGTEHKESKEATDAVALLCHDVGYACKLNYNIKENGGTGGNARDAAYALVHNFGYDKGLHLAFAHFYSEEEWAAILYKELEAGRPVQYNGMTATLPPAGHAFILDGVNEEGLYHVNWGWRGKDDNYFLLTALDPDDPGIGGGNAGKGQGYVNSQEAILGIQKPVEGSVYRPYVIETVCKPTHIALSGDFTDVDCNICNIGYDKFEGSYICKPVNAETGEELDIVLFKVDEMHVPAGADHIRDSISSIKYSGVIPDGKYYFRIYTTDKDGYTTHCPIADSKLSQMVEVRDNKFYYISNGIEIRNVKISNLVVDDPITFDIECDIVNTSDVSVETQNIKLETITEAEALKQALEIDRVIEPGATVHCKVAVDLYGEFETVMISYINEADEFNYYRTPRMSIKEFINFAGIAPVVVDAAADAPSYHVSGIPAKGNVKGIVISNGKKTIK